MCNKNFFVYSMQFSGASQRHQSHQGQPFYPTFQPPLLTPPNVFGYTHAPAPQHGCKYLNDRMFFVYIANKFEKDWWFQTRHFLFRLTDYYTASNTMSLTRASAASAVSGGAPHVTGPLAGAQGAPVVPQGTLQQATAQQAQPLPPMSIPLSQTGMLMDYV